MARLLFLPSAESALEFGKTVGLPIETDCIVMKAAPISVSDPKALTWSRQEDAFVFGKLAIDESNNDSRVDEDGVLIPSGSLLQSLIVSND